jgi:hypothetical protein
MTAPLQPPPLAVLLPARMREMTLLLPPSATAADVNCAIAAICQLVEPRQLCLRLFAAFPSDSVSFSPLSALPLLRTLAISCADELDNDLPLTDAHCAELRALVHLEECPAVGAQDGEVRAPHPESAPLSWRSLQMFTVDEESAPLLPLVPELATLDVTELRLPHLDFLTPLRRPSTLSLWLRDSRASAATITSPAYISRRPGVRSFDCSNCHCFSAWRSTRRRSSLQSLSFLSAGFL